MDDPRTLATEIVTGLGESRAGAGAAASTSAERLAPLVYEELRGLARRYMASERAGHTLQPTALVNEAYLRLVDQTRVDWRGRTHFFAIGARMMRRVLVDHARGGLREKRGGGLQRVTLSAALDARSGDTLAPDELLELHRALERLATLDERQARIVELRYFGGLTMEEIAAHLGVSKRTAEGDWTHARAWLRRELDRTT
jgi:RNA polymerase sigma factor (TIGR02999 family)